MFFMTRPHAARGRHNRPLNLVLLAVLLRTSVKEVHEPDLAEHERQNCPKSFNLDAVAQGFWGGKAAIAATDRRLSAASEVPRATRRWRRR